MKIDSAEVINELESECVCAREVLAAMQAQRDSARSVAVALEQELAEVRRLARLAYWMHGAKMTHNEAHDALARWSSNSERLPL